VFTGLIQDVGTVRGLRRGGDSVQIEIDTRLADQLREGDSLAVDGACLTVSPLSAQRVSATAVAETLERTTLGGLRVAQRVHLEPALRLGDPLGGHWVQGHIDGVGEVAESVARGVSVELSIRVPDAAIMRYVVEKGSIALHGASLTIATRRADGFTVALVPHTLEHTVFRDLRPGQRVNLEVDVLAKYVEQLLGAWARPDASDAPAGGRMDLEWLRKHGYA
jgi:riboflavin synthase